MISLEAKDFLVLTTHPDKQFQVFPQNKSTRSLNLLFQEAFHNSSKSEQGSLVLFFFLRITCSMLLMQLDIVK